MPDWDIPKWKQQGRTGPNGPQYARRSDRNKVRRGKPVGQNNSHQKGGKGDGCAVLAIVGLGSALTLLGGLAYGATEAVRAVLS